MYGTLSYKANSRSTATVRPLSPVDNSVLASYQALIYVLTSSPQLKVTHTQLVLLHGAFAAYYSGNHTAMEALVKEFHSKLEQVDKRDPPAWLEELSGSQDGH